MNIYYLRFYTASSCTTALSDAIVSLASRETDAVKLANLTKLSRLDASLY